MTDATTRTLPPRIDPTTLSEVREENAPHVLIDVRTPAEFEAAHIDGAVNVPLDVLEEDPAAIAAEIDGPAVLTCRSGTRASQAQQKLVSAGADDLRVLEGGLVAWEQSGFDVNEGRSRWDLERQVRFVAGVLVLTGILASLAWEPAKFFSAAIGLGLMVAALTNTCAMGMVLAKMPWNGAAEECDLQSVLGRLRDR